MQVNSVSNIPQVTNNKKRMNIGQINSTSFDSYLNTKKPVSLDDIFAKAAKTYQVDVNLLKAIAKQESNFNKDAVSKSGAQGIMQLMPATAKELGVTDAFDASQNIMGGSKYISQLLKRFDGDTKLALAAYNAGGGNVVKYGGIPPFEETQNYVVKVMGYYKDNLDVSGITVPSAENKPLANQPDTKVIASTAPSEALVIESISSTEELQQILSELFSYNDYLKFIELFYGSDREQGNENEYDMQQISEKMGLASSIFSVGKGIQ